MSGPTKKPSGGGRPSGLAGGALAGNYPDPGHGLFHAVGPALFDDFHWQQSSASRPGQLGWSQNNIVTTAYFAQQEGTDTEWGIRRVTTSSVLNAGGTISSAAQLKLGIPGIGSIWYSKVRASSTPEDTVIWTGFGTSTTVVPVVGNNTEFIGARCEGVGNWFGVCKLSAGAENETTVDLGVDSSIWSSFGYQVVDMGEGARGVQFFVLDLSSPSSIGITSVGAPIATHLPTGSLWALALSLVTTSGIARHAEIDFWGLGGRTAR